MSTFKDMANQKLFNVYQGMKNRCYNKRVKAYHNYGGRGIKVCQEWLDDFMNFYNWSTDNGYREDLTIDRIDTNGDYAPNNCRWITMKEQARNRRTNKMYTINGETHCLKEWCEILNLNYHTIYKRIHSHCWNIETALFTPIKKKFNKAQFRGSPAWKRKRAEVLRQDHYRCQICGCNTKLQVHHIISLDINEKLKLDNNNLITLCSNCHKDVHNNLYSQIYLINLANKDHE